MAMTKTFTERKRIRKSFGRIKEIMSLPNLIEIQKVSYVGFLQEFIAPMERKDRGIQAVFDSIFPIQDYAGKSILEFVKYTLEKPKYEVDECQQRDLTYSAPLRLTLRLTVFDIEEETGVKSIKDIKEQDVFMGDIPLMTEKGTFIVNGAERVIVSQLHRSPGVFFDHDRGKTHSSGRLLFSCRVIPYRGSWLDLEFDAKDIINVRFDRRRKMPVTTFLMALPKEGTDEGMSKEEILNEFYDSFEVSRKGDKWKVPFVPSSFKGKRFTTDLCDVKTGDVLVKADQKITARLLKSFEDNKLKSLLVSDEFLLGKFFSKEVVSPETGEVFAELAAEITEDILKNIKEATLKSFLILDTGSASVGPYIRNTLVADKNTSRESALTDIYRVMRPGEPPTFEAAANLLGNLFFNSERYDLSTVGRVKMNARLGLETDDELRVLRKEDILSMLHFLVDLRDGKGVVDDIDNLSNRRVRSVGELLENQYRIGLLRMERSIREKMGSSDIDIMMPNDFVNAKPAVAAVREFFGSSQLSQFMDQVNPLSEITHKRRLSALGPGGLTRERAGFEVRDVHPTHYGRICPIETPEGPNIGLINSLATYARVNKYGFLESPYRKVIDAKITDEIIYLSAIEESKYIICQADVNIDAKDRLVDDLVIARNQEENVLVPKKDIDFIDVSPKQLVSVAASLIPFLENDDANRALMGSNMQRQAVPLLNVEAPLVGTGMEAAVAADSGSTIVAKRDGIVDQIDGQRVVIRVTEKHAEDQSGVDIYRLVKFQRSNQSTCINQRPLVKVGDVIKRGDIIADGPSTQLGELALGRNVMVAFMPWNGYNFEDSILISEKISKDDVFTSIHISEFEVMARDTKLGQEEITRDIPNVGEDALRHLDEAGIIHVGAEVGPGDILVGKVTPKGESPITPEEKLLRAIFGEKSSDVRDSSLRLSPGVKGTVVEVRVFSRRGVEKDERAVSIERAEIEKLAKDRDAERSILERSYYANLKEMLLKQTLLSGPKGIKTGAVIDDALLSSFTKGQMRQFVVENAKVMDSVEAIGQTFDKTIAVLNGRFEDRVHKVQRGDDLLPGVMKMVKIFIAVKRKLQPGDKMAGRHGNKGVVSRILPVEDMPYMEDGTPVDIVLNPLGVPSRMNVGQILETHLGWASYGLGQQVSEALEKYNEMSSKGTKNAIGGLKDTLKTVYGDKTYKEDVAPLDDNQLVEMSGNLVKGIPFATPVFDGAKEDDINEMLKRAGFDTSGQIRLTDGRTGEQFDRLVTVGYIYMLKLNHLVDDKLHARSIGPYSLVTQQPLGGKAQFGGQRFGEMEVWALQAYGAAYTLQEMLTVKSDDVSGRTKVYESIVRGDDNFEAGIPESFNVLIKELRSLALNIELQQTDVS